MNEPTETDGSNEAAGSAASGTAESESDSESESEHECPACGDVFEGDAEYRDHLLSVGLVY